MGSEMKQKIGAVTRSDMWGIPPEKLYSPRSDPSHPEHADWLERTSPTNPKMIALIENMRQNGTDEGMPVIVYRDGGRNIIADGDCRQAACLYVNEERRREKSKRPQLLLRTVTTRDPVLARDMANACRQEDPPLLRARRFREAIGSGMEPAAAAAANELRLDYANALVKCLALPADIQARINAGEIPPDVAVRAAKKDGSAGVREVVDAATDGDGKVDAKRARKAAREATKRPRPRPARVLLSVEGELRRMTAGRAASEREGSREDIAAEVLAWARGGDQPPWLDKVIDSAEATRKAKVAGDAS